MFLPSVSFGWCHVDPPQQLPVAREFAESEYVFIGEIQSEKNVEEFGSGYLDGTIYTLIVHGQFKGPKSDTVSLFSENSSGSFPMVSGKTYIVFAYKIPGGHSVDPCGNTTFIENGLQTLKKLRK